MQMHQSDKQLYIVLSQTGTLLSRILKAITGADFNHVSISLSGDLETMYSFGRRHPYNPFWGGFVMESPHAGTFKRFSHTEVLVLKVDVTKEQYTQLRRRLDAMWIQRRTYHYNITGLCLAYFQIERKKTNCYYCSEFVGELLIQSRIAGAESLRSAIIQPIHFLHLPHSQIYRGKLSDYARKRKAEPSREVSAEPHVFLG